MRLVEALMGDPASPDTACRAVLRGVACKAVGQLTFGQDFVTKAVGNSAAAPRSASFFNGRDYVHSGIDRHSEKTLKAAVLPLLTTYELVKQDLATMPLGSEAQRSLQGVINSFENAVSTQSIAKDSIIYTAAITTQSNAIFSAKMKNKLMPPLSPLNGNSIT
ncbi:MAG: hypothetical protein U5L02_15135 [Rheinheimera sp.]|nr:hypothetical protein [Rheinheimera sp.]